MTKYRGDCMGSDAAVIQLNLKPLACIKCKLQNKNIIGKQYQLYKYQKSCSQKL